MPGKGRDNPLIKNDKNKCGEVCLTGSAQRQDDISATASGTPLDRPPELKFETPEDVRPEDMQESVSSPAEPPQDAEGDAALPDDPLPATMRETGAAPDIIDEIPVDIQALPEAEAIAEDVAVHSSDATVFASELKNRLDSRILGLNTDAGEKIDLPAETPEDAYRGLASDMIGADREGWDLGGDLMTAFWAAVTGDTVREDVARELQSDPGYRARLPKELTPEINTPEKAGRPDLFRANAETLVTAVGAAALAMTLPATAASEKPAASKAAAAAVTDFDVPPPQPAQEKAPPMTDDAARITARRREEEREQEERRSEKQRRNDAESDAAHRVVSKRMTADLQSGTAVVPPAVDPYLNQMMMPSLNGWSRENTFSNLAGGIGPRGGDGASLDDFRAAKIDITAPAAAAGYEQSLAVRLSGDPEKYAAPALPEQDRQALTMVAAPSMQGPV